MAFILGYLIKWLSGTVGPYILGGVGVLLALSLGVAGIQGARLNHAKADLVTAHAALINPITRKTWQSEAVRDAKALSDTRSDLATCRTNTDTVKAAKARQEAAVQGLKDQSAAWVAQGQKAVSDARAVAESWRQRGAAIAATPTPAGDLCVAAENLLRKGDR